MHRRHLLQFTGSTIAALTADALFPSFLAQRNQALAAWAKPGTRKLALLVGVNRYAGEGLRSLRGCLMDIEMQRELLISRFGFHPADILVLTDETTQKPTRNNILAAYESHLITQAKPDDVVVFHFSGHGSQVIDPDPITSDGTLGTLVPIDRPNATDSSFDITGRSLFLLTQALQTEQVTTILDACHSGGTFRGKLNPNAMLRSISSLNRTAEMGDREMVYQTQWLKTLQISRPDFTTRRRQGIAKGIALGSAYRNQYSADSNFGDFYAGAFSYLLTRSLWQAARNESIGTLFIDLARRTEDLADSTQIVQTPVLDIKPGSRLDRAPAYLTESVTIGAEGVVKSIAGDRLELWLGGIPAHSLEAFEKGAVFNILNAENQPIAQVKQTGRSGLTATGQVLKRSSQLVSGQLLQEQIRGIPVELSLTIGVQPSATIAGIQSSLIQSTFAAYPRFKFVELQSAQSSAVLIDAVIESVIETVIEAKSATRWQLKTSGDRVLKEVKETELAALSPALQSILAAKVLRSLANGESARLAVITEIRHADRNTLVAQSRSRFATARSAEPTTGLKPGDAIQIQIQNQSSTPLYAAAVAIDSSANLIVLHPLTSTKPKPIAPQATLTIPDRTSGATYRLTLQPPAGALEILTFTSTEPLGDILRGLKQLQPTRGMPLLPNGADALQIVGNLVGTIDREAKSRGTAAIDNSQFALMTTLIHVTE
jgi:Caspase domain/Domain of unknown function (DUF4384)